MSLISLTAENVRCLKSVTLEPAGSNLIYGENASGKTSLLEAIFILGRGRSFRAVNREGIVADGENGLLITGVVRRQERKIRLGIAHGREEGTRVRVDGRDESGPAALAHWLPVQIIDPDVHQLIEEGPGGRRKFLDWGVFHVEPDFLEAWRRYNRLIRQRNAALKDRRAPALLAWDRELADAGERLDRYRQSYVDALIPHIAELGATLLGSSPEVAYRSGWADTKSLSEALEEGRERDRRFGITHAGPHRADLVIRFASRKARGRVSRGQQKLLAATLVLGQLQHLRSALGLRATLLLDDLSAELDSDSLGRLREVVSRLDAQLFLTALRRGDLDDWDCEAVFHVEQGKVDSVL